MSWISKLLGAQPVEMPPGTLALRRDPRAPLPADELRAVRSTTTKCREGYDQDETDDLLEVSSGRSVPDVHPLDRRG